MPLPCGPELCDDVDEFRECVDTETGVPLATVALLLETERVPFAVLPLAGLIGGEGLNLSRGRVEELGGRLLALFFEESGRSGSGRPALGLRSMVLLWREVEPERGLDIDVPFGTD